MNPSCAQKKPRSDTDKREWNWKQNIWGLSSGPNSYFFLCFAIPRRLALSSWFLLIIPSLSIVILRATRNHLQSFFRTAALWPEHFQITEQSPSDRVHLSRERGLPSPSVVLLIRSNLEWQNRNRHFGKQQQSGKAQQLKTELPFFFYFFFFYVQHSPTKEVEREINFLPRCVCGGV